MKTHTHTEQVYNEFKNWQKRNPAVKTPILLDLWSDGTYLVELSTNADRTLYQVHLFQHKDSSFKGVKKELRNGFTRYRSAFKQAKAVSKKELQVKIDE